MTRPTACRSAGASNSAAILPRVMTPTRSERLSTSSRSSLINTIAAPSRAGFEQPFMNRRAGPNVETAAWTVGNDYLRRAAELSRDDQLLRIAAREKRRFLAQVANTLDVEFGHRGRCRLAHRRAVGAHP